MKDIKKNLSKWMYWFILAVAVILVYKFVDNITSIGDIINNFFNIISPFLTALLIAYLLYIPASRIENRFKKSKNKFLKKRARGLSVSLTIILTILLIILLVNVLFPIITDSIVELISNFQMYWNNTIDRLNNLPEDSILKNETVTNAVQSFGEKIKEIDLMQYLNPERITGYVKSAVGVATGVFDIFVTIVASVYFLLERGKIIEYIKKIGYAVLKPETCEEIGQYCNTTNRVFFRFISSQLIDSILVGIVVTIAMSIIGVKYAILLGFIIGLFNLIPYFGAIIAVGLSILITLVTGGLSQAILMAVVVIILQQIDANIINPKIIGTSLQISPLLVIFSVTVGGGYFGVLGMFLAVPAVTVLKLILDDYLDSKNKKKMIYNDIEDV